MGKACRTISLENTFLQPLVSDLVSNGGLPASGQKTLLGEQNGLGWTSRQAKRTPEERVMDVWQTSSRVEKLTFRLLVQIPAELRTGRGEDVN